MKTLGVVLIIIGLLGLFAPLVVPLGLLNMQDATKFKVFSIADAKSLCDSGLGELGKIMDSEVNSSCRKIDFIYYVFIGVIVIGTILFVAKIIIDEAKGSRNKSRYDELADELEETAAKLSVRQCKHCGEQLGNEDAYCKGCGRELRRTPPPFINS